jgi:hypothetical protein
MRPLRNFGNAHSLRLNHIRHDEYALRLKSGQMADPTRAYVAELCGAYRRILTSESKLLQAWERIRELEALIGLNKSDWISTLRPHEEHVEVSSIEESPVERPQTVHWEIPQSRSVEPPPAVLLPQEDGFQVLIRSTAVQKTRRDSLLKETDPNIMPTPTKTPSKTPSKPTATTSASRVDFTTTPSKPATKTSAIRVDFTTTPEIQKDAHDKRISYSGRNGTSPWSREHEEHAKGYLTPTTAHIHHVYRSEPRTNSERPPFIPGGGDTFFNVYSIRQKRERERFEESALKQPRHRGVIQQAPRELIR